MKDVEGPDTGTFPGFYVIVASDCFSGSGTERSCATSPSIAMAAEGGQPQLDGNGAGDVEMENADNGGNNEVTQQEVLDLMQRLAGKLRLISGKTVQIHLGQLPKGETEQEKKVLADKKQLLQDMMASLSLEDNAAAGDREPPPFPVRGYGLIKADCPPPERYSGFNELFSEWKKTFVRYAVGKGLLKQDWARVAASYLKDKSPAYNLFMGYLESRGEEWDALEDFSWEEFCVVMDNGNLGKPKTDLEIRDRLFDSKQRMPKPNTIEYINHMERLYAEAPTPLDDGTKCWFFLNNCSRPLYGLISVPVEGGSWKVWEELKKVAISHQNHHDKVYSSCNWDGSYVHKQLGGGSSSRSKFKTSAVSFAGVAGKDSGYVGGFGGNSSSKYSPAAAAAGGGGRDYKGPSRHVHWEDRGVSSPRVAPYHPRTASDKYGHKETYNPKLSSAEVHRNRSDFRCHFCGERHEKNGRFDTEHLKTCGNRKRKLDVSDGR
jgi:hypothetical protein